MQQKLINFLTRYKVPWPVLHYFYKHQLTSLDVSKNSALTDLSCWENQLTSLDVSKNTALTWLSCVGNKFDCDALKSKYGID